MNHILEQEGLKKEAGDHMGADYSVWNIKTDNAKVYHEIVPDYSRATLQAIIRGKVKPDTVIHFR